MPIDDLLADSKDRKKFTRGYKDQIFTIWYRAGKPGATYLYGMTVPDEDNRRPSRFVLNRWISEEFEERAIQIDESVREAMNDRLMQEKIEMLNRHAEIGKEMQDTALDYIRTNKEDLTAISAVRMLVEGVKIEKGSRGIPQVLQKMMDMTDEELLKETQNLLLKSPITELRTVENEIIDIESEDVSE